MTIPHIFITHYATEERQYGFQLLTQLIADLRSSGAEVITDGGRSTEEQFAHMLDQELPRCQWLIFIQTPEALHSPRVQTTVNTAMQLVSQERMQGIIRLVATPAKTQEMPVGWSTLTTIDASQDYLRAREKLLLILDIPKSSGRNQSSLVPPPASPLGIPSTYDRPPARPSHLAPLALIEKIKDGQLARRQRVLTVLLAGLVLLTIIGTVLGTIWHAQATAASNRLTNNQATNFGHAYFFSSGLLNADNSQGLSDSIQANLSNLKAPAPGNSYYAWLLPDKNNFDVGRTRFLGKLSLQGNSAHFTYVDPNHENLLANNSSFLVTEEPASVTPDSPSPNKQLWRYYAEFPNIPNPADTTDHYSNLDHLRHLLSNDPTLKKLSLSGGLNIWFSLNTQKVLEAASAARDMSPNRDPNLMHRQIIRALDYLDGINYVQSLGDVPPGTRVEADPKIALLPLLTFDPIHQTPPGYIHHIDAHLRALVDSPKSTPEQSDLAGKIDAALNSVNANLEQMKNDARTLVKMPVQQLLDPATLPLLDDLLVQATDAYSGQLDPTTGIRQGGVVWIYDSIEHLATLAIGKYPA